MILFLDFDGVLHPITGSAPFQSDCVCELEAVIEYFSSLDVVITSSWREEKTMDELIDLLGTTLGERIIGTTPIIDDPFLHNPRYHEVLAYLATEPIRDRKWIAIDDEAGNYPPDAPVLITDRLKGFTRDDRETLVALIQAQQ